jgi:hypothetical protein
MSVNALHLNDDRFLTITSPSFRKKTLFPMTLSATPCRTQNYSTQ